MKKVMVYCHVFYPQSSGYSNAFQNFINAILDSDSNITITVMTPFPLEPSVPELCRERLEVVRLKPKTKVKKLRYFINEYFFARQVSNKFKNENFDLLFIETFDQALFINFLDADLYDRTVVRIHSTNETEYTFFSGRPEYLLRKYLIKNKLEKKVKWVASTNSYHIDFARKYFFEDNAIKCGEKNFFVLPNPVGSNEPESYTVGERIKIFNLGRMDFLGNNQKGFTDLIYALKLLPKEVLNKFDIKIVGKGDMRDSLIELCRELENVHFVEQMPHSEVISELKAADVIILPSRYEGLSMFALEGLSTGNICLFSKTGGLVDMVEDNGIFFEPQNIESIASSLQELSAISKNKLEAMKLSSVKICEDNFSSEVVADKFSVLFDIVVKGNN